MGQGYDFRSPGGDAAETLINLLTKQEAVKRQAMIDQLNAENTRSQIKSRESEDAARVKETARLDAQQAATSENQQMQRAKDFAEQVPKGTAMTPELKASLGPLGPALTQQTGGHLDPAVGEGPTIEETFTGTTKQNQNEETLALRERIAQLSADGKAAQLQIQAALAEGRINAMEAQQRLGEANLAMHEKLATITEQLNQQKLDAGEKVKNDAAQTVKNKRYELRTLIEGIKNDPNLGHVFGPIAGRLKSVTGSSTKLDSDIARLKAMLTLEGRQQLKGQGAVSDWEGQTVGQGETVLNQAGSVDSGKAELERLLSLFQGDVPQSYEEYMKRKAGAAAPGGALTPAQKAIADARARRGGK